MLDVKEYVRSLDIETGETLTLNCPVCGGIKKFTVTNTGEGSYIYNCFRASCKVRGKECKSMSVSDIKNKLNGNHNNKEYLAKNAHFGLPEYITVALSTHLMRRFIDRWKLHHIPLFYDVKDKRAVFPIFKRGKIIDAVGRSLTDKTPKWLRYNDAAYQYTFCVGEDRGVAVVVEDIISAIVVGTLFTGVSGIALLGTTLRQQNKDALTQYNKIVVALDRDASSKTIHYTRELKSYCDDAEVVAYALKQDVKERNEEDLIGLRKVCYETA